MDLKSWMRRHTLAAFALVAFGWTYIWDALFFAFELWTVVPVSLPRVWGPAIAAIVVIWASEIPLRTWLRQRLTWRVPPRYLLVALGFPVFITNVQPFVKAVGGGTVVYDPPAPLYGMLAFIIVIMVLFGGTEELGWRGIAQPRLQQRLSVFSSGLVIGVAWWSWHLPLFFTGNPNYSFQVVPLLTYTLFILGASVVLAAFVNITEGRVLPVMLMHASVNAGALFSANGGALDGSPLVALLIGSGLWWVLAGILLGLYGWSMTPTTITEPVAPSPHELAAD